MLTAKFYAALVSVANNKEVRRAAAEALFVILAVAARS
jgi:hypothetical protein